MSIAEKLTQIAENESKVYEAGKQAEWGNFWDVFQGNGNRRNYYYAFNTRNSSVDGGWTDDIYNPKYPIVCEETTGNRPAAYTFYYCKITDTKVPIYVINTTMDNTFGGAGNLETIPLLHLTGTTLQSNTFSACTALKNITFGGEICNTFSLANSPLLTNDSVQSIIDHLTDLTGQTSQTVSFHSDVLLNLTEEQISAIGAKNWAI